jgi:hypothetical protein
LILFSKEEGVVAGPQGQLPIFEFDPMYPAVKPFSTTVKKASKKVCFNNIRQRYTPTVRLGGMAGQGSLCMQLSPLNHRDKGIEEGNRNKYLCMV